MTIRIIMLMTEILVVLFISKGIGAILINESKSLIRITAVLLEGACV